MAPAGPLPGFSPDFCYPLRYGLPVYRHSLFYGITLGLLAVGTWQAYSDLDTKVGEEASALAALYRNVSSFPDPNRAELQVDLREYARQVIDVSWPLTAPRDRPAERRRHTGGSSDTLGQF
jgi:Protein of unknown function (DUF4239)